ncbi:MAG TPA: hypothetical protein VFV75_03415 [Candidatus Polarisedimenticolaceae bacterium]|nr:hypothetical protein [Candidatus Polarisedimenticolaceae bacterium]
MSAAPCPREHDVLEALRSGAWPAGCDEELRAHPPQCPGCRDLVEVTAALFEDRDAGIHEAPIPGSGLVWWKLQLRLRQEAMRSARRTLLLVQASALSIAGGLALLMLQLFVPDWSAMVAAALPVAVRSAVPIGLDVLAVAILTAGPLVAYLVSRKG